MENSKDLLKNRKRKWKYDCIHLIKKLPMQKYNNKWNNLIWGEKYELSLQQPSFFILIYMLIYIKLNRIQKKTGSNVVA